MMYFFLNNVVLFCYLQCRLSVPLWFFVSSCFSSSGISMNWYYYCLYKTVVHAFSVNFGNDPRKDVSDIRRSVGISGLTCRRRRSCRINGDYIIISRSFEERRSVVILWNSAGFLKDQMRSGALSNLNVATVHGKSSKFNSCCGAESVSELFFFMKFSVFPL